ncbi:MAG: aminotransferase class I/II-fold pyridoxal phosphate-dependent enzyme [Rhizobacter sp.]|nr:aminotransferase class I/II-fold pyridoxal phosphate-dependent enzyme [Rhizobacter sp.]
MNLPRVDLDLTQQEPIPPAGVAAALSLMRSGKLHRYGETGDKPSEVSSLELEFARELGLRYCVALNSCGSAMFVALRAAGVKPGDAVLSNCFTLAPVPGAIAHVGAKPVLVDVADDYTIDLADLERKARDSGAKTLLLSHMRGHICDMERLSAICREHGVQVVEDCAHTMGAGWNGRATGTWGRAGCFSLQSYKHVNGGEGGLLVTDDDDLAAQAILLSGSYMLYGSHLARPADAVFERWKLVTPNFSLRMGNLPAALARPQFGAPLVERCRRWNERYAWIEAGLSGLAHLRLPARPAKEQFVASSIQFSLVDMPVERRLAFIAGCAARGVHVKWFGADQPAGFTSVWHHWRYFGEPQTLPNAEHVLGGLCDMRLPLHLSQDDCEAIAEVIRGSLALAVESPPP